MSVLHKIAAQRREDVKAMMAAKPLAELVAELAALAEADRFPCLDLHARLVASGPMALLAEIKRASPSKGDIAVDIDVPRQALEYARGGAAGISVLTEPTWFKGTLADMRAVRAALGAEFEAAGAAGEAAAAAALRRPAVLCKDFIVHEYQLHQARLHGADTVLLIVAILDDAELGALLGGARALGMEPLVEVNCAAEMERALRAGARVVGVNNRNLHVFSLDMDATNNLMPMVQAWERQHGGDVVVCALSGISTHGDVEHFAHAGVRAVLVGEALMRAANPRAFIAYLLGLDGAAREPLVKVCGIRSVEAAVAAAEAGADLIGMIFVPGRSRTVTTELAGDIVAAVRRQKREVSGSFLDALRGGRGAGGGGGGGDGDGGGDGKGGKGGWFALCAQQIERELHQRRPLVVGVFLDASAEEINAVARDVGIDFAQFHGNEPLALCAQVAVPVVNALHVSPSTGAEEVRRSLVEGHFAVALLDTKVAGASAHQQGGSGVAFDWSVARDVSGSVPAMVAGGLHAGNVAAACRETRAWAVDVSSGVETDGQKDVAKIKEFVRNAKRCYVDT